MRRSANPRGFTLIELLIVVAIIGILAAIAIPNLLNAMQRAKQKKTMANMREIAGAWEARHVDDNTYAAAGAGFDWPATAPITYASVNSILVPTYIRKLPENDGWNRPLEFAATSATYGIRSCGRNGVPEGASYTVVATSNFDCDIVYADGSFVVYPQGVQTSGS